MQFVANGPMEELGASIQDQMARSENVKIKTSTSEYQRPITKIVVIYPAEGYEE